ncbi:MAG: NADH-quinone oxidoreductase subunit J, partial [Planctomycetaceae bacterium]
MNEWMQQHPASICGLVLWAISLLWLMPSGKPGKSRPGLPGVILAAAGVLSFCLSAGLGVDTLQSEVMFWTFAVTALLCAALMITSKNPVYGALWFALATLGTCGLFMLQSAPFLAAAT